VTRTQSIHSASGDELTKMVAMYRRLATMDPPALRSLAVDVQRLSDAAPAALASGQLRSLSQESC
jgi:hypothetical protein